MIKKLAHPGRIVFSCFCGQQGMRFPIVLEHPGFLTQPPERSKQFYSLGQINDPILPVIHHQERSGDLMRVEDGGVFYIEVRSLPEGGANASLTGLRPALKKWDASAIHGFSISSDEIAETRGGHG